MAERVTRSVLRARAVRPANAAREQLRALRLAVGAGRRADPRGMAVGLLLDALRGSSVVVHALLLKLLVDAAVGGDLPAVVQAGVGLGVFTAVPWLAGGLGSRRQMTLDERTAFFLEHRLAEVTASLPGLEHLERPEYLDRLEIVRSDSGALGGVASSVLVAFGLAVQAAFLVALLVGLDPLLALLPLFGLPTLAAQTDRERRLGRAEEEAAPADRRVRHLEQVATDPGLGKEMRVLGLSGKIRDLHREAADEGRWRRDRARRRGAIHVAGAGALFTAAHGAAVTFVAIRALAGAATLGDVVLVVRLARAVQVVVTSGARTLAGVAAGLRTARRLLWLFDYARSAQLRPAPRSAPQRLERGITLQGVSFSYPATDRTVLRDVSVTLAAGQVTALVGENGAGKTTLVKLLLRCYDPDEGRIVLDDLDLGEVDPVSWRERAAGAFQDFWRPELTLGEAVGVGDLPRLGDDAAVLEALERSGADALPRRFGAGLQSQLGRSWEGGIDPSGGQWQQIALARGLMRDHPLLLVLDEPTANLDAATEHALFERITEAARGRRGAGAVTVLVSHRFSTVRMADLIVVLQDGRVIEQGSHDELVRRDGLYAELYGLHARAFR